MFIVFIFFTCLRCVLVEKNAFNKTNSGKRVEFNKTQAKQTPRRKNSQCFCPFGFSFCPNHCLHRFSKRLQASILFAAAVPQFLDLDLDLDLNVIPSLDVRVEVKQKTLDLDLATTKHVQMQEKPHIQRNIGLQVQI